MKMQCGMRNAKCGTSSTQELTECSRRLPASSARNITNSPALRTPHSALRTSSRGFTYIALLAAIAIIGISMGAAGKYWSFIIKREKEEELLFRGGQYRLAVEKYVTAIPGRPEFPRNIDDLLSDGRTAAGRRHLRREYKDPVTGEDFELIKDPARGNRVIGVRSTSDKEPLKQGGFSDEDKAFEGKKRYLEWEFVYAPPLPAAAAPRPAAPAR